MLKNYFKIAFRNLHRNFTYSFINIAGLAIGLASCLLIVLYVQHEHSYDTFHSDSEHIYRVGFEVSLGSGSKRIASSPYRLAGALQNDFAQLEKITHFSRLFTEQVKYNNKNIFRESEIAFADSNFFNVFNFEFIDGNRKTALNRPGHVVITEYIASKYFGDDDPIGKVLEIGDPYSDESMNLLVSGVIREMPSNSHFHINFLVSMPTGETVYPNNLKNSWGWDSHYTYVVLPNTYQPKHFQDSLLKFGKKYINEDWFVKFFSQKVEDIHLYSNLNSEIEANGSISNVNIFTAVSIIILIIACINYMNLATARATERAREVGIRKSIGAYRRQLIGQFLGESIGTVGISLLLAVGLAELAMPFFNEISGKSIEINLLTNYQLLFGFVGLTIFIGILSGIYPAFFLSSFQPVKVLKESTTKLDKGALFLRKGLVVTQFTISIVLIIGTIIIFNQLDFLRSKDVGAETDNVVLVPVQSEAIADHYETIRDVLLGNSGIKQITTSNRRFGTNINSGEFYSIVNNEYNKSRARLSNIWVGREFFDFYNIRILDGHGFSKWLPSDTTNSAVVINQAAAKILELDPKLTVGSIIKAGDHFQGTITGLVEDFNFEPLKNKIKPMVFILSSEPANINIVSIKTIGQNMFETLKFIRSTWKEFDPNRIFLSSFLNQDLNNLYVAEERFMKVFAIFTIFAIITACLGIFGLAKFRSSQRTKEIGIRKVLGATSYEIIKLLTSEVVKLTGIAFLIAIPLAYMLMNQWLQEFAYKTSISPWIFVFAGILTGFIAWLTVFWQTMRAALVKPVESLKSE